MIKRDPEDRRSKDVVYVPLLHRPRKAWIVSACKIDNADLALDCVRVITGRSDRLHLRRNSRVVFVVRHC